MAGKWAEDDSKKLAAEQALAASFPVNPVLRQHLQAFWQQQSQEMAVVSDFKNHNLPLARIKKIMKSDEDVRMISSEAPALFAKACEMFILEVRAALVNCPQLSGCSCWPGLAGGGLGG
jgi:hypothetical protein